MGIFLSILNIGGKIKKMGTTSRESNYIPIHIYLHHWKNPHTCLLASLEKFEQKLKSTWVKLG